MAKKKVQGGPLKSAGGGVALWSIKNGRAVALTAATSRRDLEREAIEYLEKENEG